MKTLKQAEKITGIKSDNLRQMIARKTVRAIKKGRDWFISEVELLKIIKTKKEGHNAKDNRTTNNSTV